MAWAQFQKPKPGYAIDSSFPLNEALGRILPEPEYRNASDFSPLSYSTNYDGGVFTFRLCGKTIIESISNERLKRIQHEIIFNCYQEETDVRLSKIGVQGIEAILTPDYIDFDRKFLMDLAGIADTSEKSLRKEYDDKIKKYRYLAESVSYRFDAVIVSSTRVLTGFEMKQSAIDALCYRHRTGLALKAYITSKLGKDIFYEDLSWAEERVKNTFSKIRDMSQRSDKFDTNLMKTVNDPITADEIKIGKSIMINSLKESQRRSPESESDLLNYFESFTPDNSRVHNKRVCNIPQILMTRNKDPKDELDPTSSNMPEWLKIIWMTAKDVKQEETTLIDQIKESMGEKDYDKHRVQKSTAFRVDLTKSQKTSASATGLFGKECKGLDSTLEKREEDSKSFNPLHNSTLDIEDYLKEYWLEPREANAMDNSILEAISSAKNLWNKVKSTSMSLSERILNSKCLALGSTTTEVIQEIAYCYKYWVKGAHFHHKKSKSGIHIIVRSTGTHIFVSCAYPKSQSEIVDTGKIGPELYDSPNFWFTDIMSFNEPDLEHFVKAGPFLLSIIVHLMSQQNLELDEQSLSNTNLNCDVAGIMLLYFNNKTDSEELMTNQRYLTMGVLEEVDPNPFRFVDRLPEVLRSRLTCFLVCQTMRLMYHYASARPIKATGPEPKIAGLLSIFNCREVEFSYKINEFYYGYVVSKERGRGNDRNFKIMKKIVAEEYKARDKAKTTLIMGISAKTYCTNFVLLRIFCSLFRSHLQGLYGSEWRGVVEKEILMRIARTSFSDLATMKVASRTYSNKINVPVVEEGATTSEILRSIKILNPNEVERRPRVLEALNDLILEYKKFSGIEPDHVVDLLPYCLAILIKKGYFDSDIFPKPQHGGDREIHVLEIKARICQYHFETAARAISSLSPSDSLTHPGQKEGFIKAHHKKCSETMSSYHTLGKSADATKWCQRNHSSKFASMVLSLCPEFMYGFVLSLMWLWIRKRISFPIQFVANFIGNQNVRSNPVYKRMQQDFMKGEGLFTEIQNNKMWITFGMFQGILHYMSTLCHLIILVCMAIYQTIFLRKQGLKAEVTHVQGSDDSAQLISAEGKATKTTVKLISIALMWKEKVAEHFSIYCSRAKSSIGALDLVEFNSEWSYKQHTFKPTFRWVSACLTSPITERFVDRIRQNQNTLTSLLEGGGKILEVAVIQISQAWLHYLLIGFSLELGSIASTLLVQIQDPSVGFYPLDSDFTVGVTGSEFLMYSLYKLGKYRPIRSIHESDIHQTGDEVVDTDIPKSLRAVKIPFGNMNIWYGTLRRMDIPQLEEIISDINSDPSLIFENHKNWNKGKYTVFLKMFQPGVKESISAYSPIIRQMASSAYILSRPCMVKLGKTGKHSLLKLIYNAHLEEKVILEPKDIIPYHAEYDDMIRFITELEQKHALISQPMSARSKLKVSVFEKFSTEFPVLDMCKRQWKFPVRLALSNKQFSLWWPRMKQIYPFLHDSLALTQLVLGMNVIELHNYLSSLSTKSRDITLLDTTAKGTSIKHVVTRIFWPHVKIARPLDPEFDIPKLRQELYSISCSWFERTDKDISAEKALLRCRCLDSWPDSPDAKKLKVFRDWKLGRDKFQIMLDVQRYHLGNYGVFTVTQDGFGLNRRGAGEWLGVVSGVSVKICMSNNICTKIFLSSLEETMVLGPNLIDILHTFNLVAPVADSLCKLWLSDKGKFSQGSGLMNNQFQCFIDKELTQIEVDEFAIAPWFVDLNHGSIRLKATLSSGERITIISEKFKKSDWAGYTTDIGSTVMNNWINGEPIPVYAIEDNILSSIKRTDLSQSINKGLLLSKEGWNIHDLIKNIAAAYSLEITEQSVPSEEGESTDLAEIDEWALALNTTLEGAESIGSSESDDGFDNLEVDDLEEFLEMFEYESPGKETTLRTTPVARACFSGLNSLCYLQLGISFQDFIKNTGKSTGLLGIIKSLMHSTSEYYILESTFELIEISVASKTAELMDESTIGDLDQEELKRMIKYLNQRLKDPTTPKLIKDRDTRSLELSERLLHLHSRRTEPDSLESMKSIYLVNKLISDFWEVLRLPKEFKRLSPQVLLTAFKDVIETRLSENQKLGKISNHDHNLMLESLRAPQLTSFMIDAISIAFGIKISVLGYKSGFGDLEVNV